MAPQGPEPATDERSLERFFEAAAPSKEPMGTRAYPVLATLCVIVSVPFYWQPSSDVIWGLPPWVWVTLGASAALSAVTAYFALRVWDDTQGPEER